MLGHGLKPWHIDDVKEAKALIEKFREQDAARAEASRAAARADSGRDKAKE
jgi:hypothetical protein